MRGADDARDVQEELAKEKLALGADSAAEWQSDSEEEEFFRREAEQIESNESAQGEPSPTQQETHIISTFLQNVSVE